MRHLKTFILTLVLMLVSGIAYADRGGFHYKKITYEAVVHKNNVWDVKETFYIDFSEPRHGYYRYVTQTFCLKFDVSKEGEKEHLEDFWYRTNISNVKVEGGPIHDEYEENNNYIIQIGDADTEVTGLQKYVISYTYAYPDDRNRDMDFVFHSILGDDFGENIDKFEFNIKFDKALPANVNDILEVYSGVYGYTGNVVKADIEANEHVISGSASNIAPNHAFTFYIPLQEGYYEGVPKDSHWGFWIWFGLSVVCLAGIFIGALMRKKDKHMVKTIEFYPPEGISSAEVGYIIDMSVDEEDIASLIPWFASKGYLKIKEVKDNKGKDTLELTKLKNLPSDAPEYQKKLFHLFFASKSSRRLSELGERPNQMEEINNALSDHFDKDDKRKLTDISMSYFWYIPLWIASTFTYATNLVQPFQWEDFFMAVWYWATPAIFGFFMRDKFSGSDLMSSKARRVFIFIGKALLMLIIMFFYCLAFYPYGAPMNELMVFGFAIANFLAVEMVGAFNENTDYRIDLMGRLLGLKEFIETAEKPRLEQLLEDDPDYFYQILPYAMVFDLTNKWSKQFKDLNLEKPDWYDAPANSNFAVRSFTSNLFSSTHDAISTISHDSSSSSSSGGFSGGGGGGGGGGSW